MNDCTCISATLQAHLHADAIRMMRCQAATCVVCLHACVALLMVQQQWGYTTACTGPQYQDDNQQLLMVTAKQTRIMAHLLDLITGSCSRQTQQPVVLASIFIIKATNVRSGRAVLCTGKQEDTSGLKCVYSASRRLRCFSCT